jgi:hypothetical protein
LKAVKQQLNTQQSFKGKELENMRNKQWSVLVTLLALAVFAGCAKQETGRTFAFKFKSGDVLKYHTILDMKSTVMGQSFPMKMDIEQSNTVKDVLPSGSARIEQRLDKVAVTSEGPMAAMTGMLEKQLEGKSFQMVTSPGGKVDSLSGLNDFGNASQSGMNLDQMASNLYAPLPEKPVKPGDSWSQDKTLPMTVAGTALSNHLVMKFTLLGYEQKNGASCAKIKTDGTFELTGGAGPQGSMSGKGTVDGTMYFDPAAGRVVSSSGKTTSTMNMAPPKGMQITMTMEQNITVDLVP